MNKIKTACVDIKESDNDLRHLEHHFFKPGEPLLENLFRQFQERNYERAQTDMKVGLENMLGVVFLSTRQHLETKATSIIEGLLIQQLPRPVLLHGGRQLENSADKNKKTNEVDVDSCRIYSQS